MNAPTVEFDADLHRYTVAGEVLPSVTTILQVVNPIRGAMAAAARGTEVHRLTEVYDLGQSEPVPAELAGYIVAYVNFLRDHNFEPLHIEERVHHPEHLYAGSLDRIGVLHRDLAVVDIKTGMIRPVTGLQLAAYQEAWNWNQYPREQVTHRYALHLHDDSTYDLIEYGDPDDFKRFLACLTLHEWLKANRAPADYDQPMVANKRKMQQIG